MKIVDKLTLAPIVLLATQAQAAVPVSGFTIDQATRPYGLILMALVLVGLGLSRLRSS